jgi:predicted component of type VI protein secretion system
MAYIVVCYKDEEVARRKLEGPLTLGRSPECDLAVHDILLSRRHCRIEPDGEGWACVDLGSKNGTRIGGTPVFRLPLTEGDVIRMGKTAVRFRAGELVVRSKPDTSSIKRPADPIEALAGTVSDFSFQPPIVATNGIPFPMPRPAPREPEAYADEDVRSLVCELVSSSWDSMYETASRSELGGSRNARTAVLPARRRCAPQPRVALQLQAQPESDDQPTLAEAAMSEDEEGMAQPEIPSAVSREAARIPRLGFVVRRVAVIFQWLPLALLPLLKGH